jgi:hypothetical protein
METHIENIIETLKHTVRNKEFIDRHKRFEKDFTRMRNLAFEDVMTFVMGNLGTSMDFEILNFCDGRSSVTAAAISKARDKINHTAFVELLKVNAESIPVRHTFKGYRLTSYDGMKGELPRTPELMQKYAVSTKNEYPQFHAVVEYDVLNCCYTNAVFKPGTTDEREAAMELFKEHRYAGAEIYLLDRGFPSLALIQQMNEAGKKYVMRVSKSFLREVNDFRESTALDANIMINYDKRRASRNRIKGVELPCAFNLRCVKIELGSDECEILVTNLYADELSRKELGELYNLRWKIETGFLNLKYAVRVEDFIGIKENSIKQEFFASLIKSNVYMQFVGVANDFIHNKKNAKTRIRG